MSANDGQLRVRPWRAPRGHASASPPHANRAHLAARKEGLDRGVPIVHGGAVSRRLAVLRRGHAEGDGGGARGSSAAKRTAGGRRTRRRRSNRARAPPSPTTTMLTYSPSLDVAWTASGYAARSAFTTATVELFAAALWRGVYPYCTWHTRRAGGRLSDEAGGGWRRGRMIAAHRAGGGVPLCPSPWRPPGTPRGAPAPPPPMGWTERQGGVASSRTARGTPREQRGD